MVIKVMLNRIETSKRGPDYLSHMTPPHTLLDAKSMAHPKQLIGDRYTFLQKLIISH